MLERGERGEGSKGGKSVVFEEAETVPKLGQSSSSKCEWKAKQRKTRFTTTTTKKAKNFDKKQKLGKWGILDELTSSSRIFFIIKSSPWPRGRCREVALFSVFSKLSNLVLITRMKKK